MAATQITTFVNSPVTGVALAMSSVITVAAGVTYNFAYKPVAGSTGRGAQVWVTLDGLNTNAANLIPLIVKWEDRASVQGYVNPQWICSVSGPIDIVLDKSNDMTANYFQFS